MLAAALVVAGCAAPDASKAPNTTSPAKTTTPSPSAADGKNVAACADGNCEVLLTGPVDIDLGGHGDVATMSVTGIDSSGVHVSLKDTGGGTGTADLGTGCTLTFVDGGGGSSCGGRQDPPPAQTGVLAAQLVHLDKGSAVLRLVSGPLGDPPTWMRPPVITPPNW